MSSTVEARGVRAWGPNGTGRDDGAASSGQTQPPLPRVRFRRRKGLAGLGVALLALGGGGAYVLVERSSDAVNVLAIAEDVPRGQIIEEGDLTVASALPDPALAPVPTSRIGEIVGQRASSDLSAGSLVTEDAVTTELIPGAGETVVGVAVTEIQLPSEPITPGARVRIVSTPSPGDDPPQDSPESVRATVVSVSSVTETGHIIVNVLVDEGTASELAARVATGRIVVVLDSLENGDQR